MTKTNRSLSLLAFAAALIGLLLVLGPNLHRIELDPGRPSLSPPEGVQTVSPDLGSSSTGAGAVPILIRTLMIAALTCLAFIVVGAIFNKAMRVYLIAFVVVCLLIIGFYYYVAHRPRTDADPQMPESPLPSLMAGRPAMPTAEGSTEPPSWSFPAVAIGISVCMALLVAVAWAKLAPRWRRRAEEGDRSALDELIETVASAADDIQLGGDPRSAVLRCYREMIRILCRKKAIDHVHMTARELAAALHRAGFTTRHVGQLTEIFELVRYGNRGGQPLAERAIGCLEAIRKAYAT